MASRQDALQTIFSGRRGIFYAPKSRLFQHPQAESLIEPQIAASSGFWMVGNSSITRRLTSPDRFESEDDR
jgi:hypothetical protein